MISCINGWEAAEDCVISGEHCICVHFFLAYSLQQSFNFISMPVNVFIHNFFIVCIDFDSPKIMRYTSQVLSVVSIERIAV